MRRAVLVFAVACAALPAAVFCGCSTSNVHPATYGDCLDSTRCANNAPRGDGTPASDAGTVTPDGGTDGARSDAAGGGDAAPGDAASGG